MKIGYFTNQYPAVSHTFIRREIQALAVSELEVVRFAIRPASGTQIHPEDAEEQQKTIYLTKTSYFHVVTLLYKSFFTRPNRTFNMLYLAFQLGWKSDRGLLRHAVYAVEAVVLADLCEQEKIEHLHVHFGTNPATIAMLASILSHKSFSFTAHGSEEFEKAPLLALGLKVARSAFAIGVSSFGCAQLMRWSSPEHWSKIFCVHCGVDDAFLSEPVSPVPSELRFVCVGRLGEHKAQLLLINATREVVDAGFNCHVVLAGDGPMRPRLEALIRSLNLENNVTITGWIPSEQVRSELTRSRALVLPSFSENMPVVIMEAMAVGRPVVSTYVAGIPELVIPGSTGWLVPAGDVSALAEALKEVARMPVGELCAMGKAGRDRVSNQFDARKEAQKLRLLFERVIHMDQTTETQ